MCLVWRPESQPRAMSGQELNIFLLLWNGTLKKTIWKCNSTKTIHEYRTDFTRWKLQWTLVFVTATNDAEAIAGIKILPIATSWSDNRQYRRQNRHRITKKIESFCRIYLGNNKCLKPTIYIQLGSITLLCRHKNNMSTCNFYVVESNTPDI